MKIKIWFVDINLQHINCLIYNCAVLHLASSLLVYTLLLCTGTCICIHFFASTSIYLIYIHRIKCIAKGKGKATVCEQITGIWIRILLMTYFSKHITFVGCGLGGGHLHVQFFAFYMHFNFVFKNTILL